METSYLFHNREEGRATAAWAQRPGMMWAVEESPPTKSTPGGVKEEEMSSSLLLGVLPLLGFRGAGRNTDGSFHRARTSLQDMRFSTALLNTSWKSATSHEKKNWRWFPLLLCREGSSSHCLYYIQISSSNKIFPLWSSTAKNLEKTLVHLFLWDDTPYWEK